MADAQSNIKVSIDTAGALASIKNLQRQISAFHTSMAQSGAAANAVTAQMQQNLINSINATGKFSAQMRTIRTTTESFTDSLQKNKFSLGEYFRYAGGASKSFGRLFKTEFETINKVARENVKDLQTQYIKMGRDANGAMRAISVRPLSLDMNDLATKTMIASEKQALLNQLLKQGSTNLLNFGKNTQWAGRQLMVGFTIPLMAAGSAAAKAFMDMETQAIRFKKVYGDLFTPQAESKQALEDIKDLGKEFTKYGIAVSSTVGLAAEAAAAGFKGLDLQRQTTAATKLSILGQVESQKALETTIALQNAFAMSSENLAESIDFLNAVENQTVLSLDDMSTAIPKAAPVVQQLGGDVKDLAFLMTAMKEGGINASEGANALKSGLASLINPTGKANDMLLSFGINAKKIVENNRGNLKKTVIDFASALNELDPLNRAQVIEQMFGKFQFARLSTLFANVTKDGTQAARVLDLASASVQDLAAMSEKELGMTSESAMNKFKGAVENLKLALVPVGEEFLKAVTPIAEFVTKILDGFNNLGAGTKKIIITLTAVVAGLGPVLLMTFGLLANGVANIIKGFTFMKTLFNKTGQSSATLGTEVKYMTLEQRNAAAVAASLDQVHRTLAQTFTAEASAVDALTRAYQRSIAAQAQFVPSARPMVRGPITKRAEGKPAVVGGTGNKDSELALLMPGETVIPTKMSKKYGSLINGMIADSIPGYEFGKPGQVSMYPEYALRLQDAAENMGQRSGRTGVPNVLAPLALRIGEARGIAPTQGQIDSGSFDSIYDEYKDITTNFVDKLNSEYTETFADIKDENERMQKAWSSAGKHVAEQVDTIKSESERSVVRKTFGLERDEYGTIPTDSREAGGTTPNRARRGAFKARLAGFRSYTAIRPGAKRLFERKTETSAKNLQMGHVYGPIQEDISTLQADPRRSGAVASAAKIIDRGKKDGKAYEKGVKESVKDPYVASLDRGSPHPLAAKHGKEDAIAYEDAKKKQMTQSGKARRVATRAQGPAPIGPVVPTGTSQLSIVAPLTESESRRESRRQAKATAVGRVKSVGNRMNSFGGGMGLLGANMGLSMLPDFAGKGMAQGALAGANLGMMFGPYGQAAGAAIGLVSTAIAGLIEKQKQLKAMNEAVFKSSADVATFFGNAVVDTTIKVGSLTSSITTLDAAAGNAGKSFGYTNEELSRFIALIESLPENNPLRDLVEGLEKENDPEKIIKIANAFIATQVAIGQLKPEQAQKQLDLLLASAGKMSMVGNTFVKFTSQVQAISIMLKNAAGSSVDLGNSLVQLTGAAANASSLEQMKTIIDGIAASGISGAAALTTMYQAYLLIGRKDLAGSVKVLEQIPGLTGSQISFLIQAAARGFADRNLTSKTTAAELVKKAEKWLEDNKDKLFPSTDKPDVTKTKAYKSQEEESNGLKKQIDLLKKKKKIVDNQIKQQEKITNQIKRQNDYLNKQRDLDAQIVEAKARGNYIEAANLLQEKNQNTIEYNQEEEKSKLQEQSDDLQAQIDLLELRSADLVAAMEKASSNQIEANNKAAASIVDAINSQGGFGFTPDSNAPRARRNRSGQPFPSTPAPANVNRVGGPTVNQTVVDPKTGKRVMLEEGVFSEKLSKFKKGGAGYTVGKVVHIGPYGDIPAIITNDITKPKTTGSIIITKIDKDTGVLQFRVHAAAGGYIKHFEPGGNVSGPGTGTSDSIPAMLSDGEYVIKASSVAKYGTETFDALNAQKFSTGGPTPAAKSLLSSVSSLFPKRSRVSDGMLPSAAHMRQNPSSDHNTGHAVDITNDPKNGVVGSRLFQTLRKDPRTKYLIFGGRIWNSSIDKNDGSRIYRGSNPHNSHIHVSIKRGSGNNAAPWLGAPHDMGMRSQGVSYKRSSPEGKPTLQKGTDYVVKPGDTLSAIASSAKTTVAKILAANPKLSSLNKYMGGSKIFSGTRVKIPGFAKGGMVGSLTSPRQKKPGVPYSRSGMPIGDPFGQYWGELSRFVGPRSPGMDIWGGTEIPGLKFTGKYPQHSDYMHQMLEQPRKPFNGPGMGIDKDPMRYAGSGASMGGIGNGAYGLGPLMFANGGMVSSAPHAMGMSSFGVKKSEKKPNWFQRYVSNLTKSSDSLPKWARDPLGAQALLRKFAGQSRKGDNLSAALMPLNFMGLGLGARAGIGGAKAASAASKFGPDDAIPISRYVERPTSANNRGVATVLHKGVFGEDAGTFFRALSDHDMASIAGYVRVPNPNRAKFDDAYRAQFPDVPQIVDRTVEAGWSSLARRWKPETSEIFPRGVMGPADYSEAALPYLNLDPALPIGGSWIPDTVKSITRELDFAKEIATRGGTSGGQNNAIARIIVDPMVQGLADFRNLLPGHNASAANPAYTEGAIAPFTRYILEGIKKNAYGYTDTEKNVTHLIDEYIFKAVQTSPYAQFLGRDLEIRSGKNSWDQLLPIVKKAKGGMVNYKLPSYNLGSPYIPEDQIAQLHKGERVLTAEENKNFSSTGPVTNNITINGADKDPKQIAQEVMLQLERMQSKNNKTNLVGR